MFWLPAPFYTVELGPTSPFQVDVVAGAPPVPISVWRVAADAGWSADLSRFTPRLASLLIGLYTRVGDTVVDLIDDPAVAGAAGAGGRRYLHLNRPTAAIGSARLSHLA